MNLYTQLQILAFDRIAFAHSLMSANYSYQLTNRGYGIYGKTPQNGGVLEIGFVEKNPVVLRGAIGEFTVEENCIFIIPPDCSFFVETRDAGMHRHTSAEFLLQCHTAQVDRFQPPKGLTLTLPLIIPPSQGSNEVFSLIRSIVHAKTARLARSYLEEYADFLQLLSKLSALAQHAATEGLVSPGNRRYCRKVKHYISENIHRKLTVGEIAAAIGISKNYLTNIFKDAEGMPLTEYINRHKLEYMLELIRRYGYTLDQVKDHVGFSDSNYISRIFRRYYGMTVTEYKQNLETEASQ